MSEIKQNKIKVAFIGGGINSAVGYAHYSALNLDNNFELVAGYFSRDNNINKESAELYRVNRKRLYFDIDELIEHEKEIVDAIIVLTPTDQHADQVNKIIKSNVPVICEKSVAGSSEDAKKIKSIVGKNDSFLVVIYNYLGYPMIRELKKIINNGKLGKINHIQIEMPQEGFARVDLNNKPIIPQKWRLEDNNIPTISLDLGVHLHMFIKYLTDSSPLKVVAQSSSKGNFNNVTDNVNCLIEYDNNLTCNMWFSKIALGYRNGLKLRIYGDKGSAEWIQEFPEELHLADNKANRWKIDRGNEEIEIAKESRYNRFKVGHPAGYLEALANYYQDIAKALTEFKENKTCNYVECFGIEDALEGLELFEAVQKSSMKKEWVEIKKSKDNE